MTEVVFLFAEITTEQGHQGLGFSYSKRAGGPAQYAHAKEVAEGMRGEKPNDIGRIYTKLLWAGASVGRSGVATQTLADQRGLDLAPHFAMEIHLHLAAAYPREAWVEHFGRLDPLFNERLETKGGRMLVPNRPGLGVSLSEQARAWTTDGVQFGLA